MFKTGWNYPALYKFHWLLLVSMNANVRHTVIITTVSSELQKLYCVNVVLYIIMSSIDWKDWQHICGFCDSQHLYKKKLPSLFETKRTKRLSHLCTSTTDCCCARHFFAFTSVPISFLLLLCHKTTQLWRCWLEQKDPGLNRGYAGAVPALVF